MTAAGTGERTAAGKTEEKMAAAGTGERTADVRTTAAGKATGGMTAGRDFPGSAMCAATAACGKAAVEIRSSAADLLRGNGSRANKIRIIQI